MLIDLWPGLVSAFLLWAAVILTALTVAALLFDSPRRKVQLAGIATVLLWAAGTLVPILV